MAGVLWRHGFGPHLRAFGLSRFLPSTPDRELDPATTGLALPFRLRLACEEIGPVTVKLAQALASRPDLVPLEYAREFRLLQDHVQPFPFEEARELIEEELGAPLDQLFIEFGHEPAASASIGQVHYAVLPDGHRLAIKVQRPEVEQTVETDLQILNFAAREAEQHSKTFRDFRVAEWTAEFARTLHAELDYANEGHNTDRLRESLKDDPQVVVPRVHWSHSGRKVLALEWMDGVPVDDFEGLKRLGVSRTAVASRMAESVLRQVLVNGFLHADPHGGNLLVQPDGRLVFLDCGNAVSIGTDTREAMVHLLLGALEDDADEVCDHIIDIGVSAEDTDLQQLRSDVHRVLGHYSLTNTSELRISDVLEELMAVVFRHKVRLPTIFASILRALILAEGNCRQLDPQFDFRAPAQAVAREVLRSWARPRNVARELWRGVRDLHRYSRLIPRQLSEVLGRAQAGGLKIKFELDRMDHSLHHLDTMINRLAFAMVVASMLVGSSVILASDRAVKLLSTPGAIAYGLVGALMGLYLLYSILRSGRL